MTAEVFGPAWTTTTSVRDLGRFPLGVETATLANSARLVPTVNSGTAHPRYYVLHAAAVAHVPADAALNVVASKVRRAEVALCAASLQHVADDPRGHAGTFAPPEAHGTWQIKPALESGVIDISDLAGRYSKQPLGFLSAYRGAEIITGLIAPQAGPPRPGPVALPAGALAAVQPVLDAAAHDSLDVQTLRALGAESCVCAVRSSADGDLLRGLLLGGENAPPAPDDIRRARARTSRSARLLIEALTGSHVGTPVTTAMANLCCYDDLSQRLPDPAQQAWAMYWRGALLRNATVTAWRWLWWWLTEQLRASPLTASQLGDALAAELMAAAGADQLAFDALVKAQPERTGAGGRLLNAEGELLYPAGADSDSPLDYIRAIVLGGLRLDDLEGNARQSFLEPAELGPEWIQAWTSSLGTQRLSDVGRQLTGLLLRQAEEISRRRARWEGGQLRLPSRLRQVGDVLELVGEEGSVEPGLRLGRLTQILGALSLLTWDWESTTYAVGPVEVGVGA